MRAIIYTDKLPGESLDPDAVFIDLPRSNKHGRKRPYMEKYDEIHGPVSRSVYLRVVYGEIRRYTESVIVDLGVFHWVTSQIKKIRMKLSEKDFP